MNIGCDFPICSMYGIFTYIWMIFRANVGKYSIHGAYGFVCDVDEQNNYTHLPCVFFGCRESSHVCQGDDSRTVLKQLRCKSL